MKTPKIDAGPGQSVFPAPVGSSTCATALIWVLNGAYKKDLRDLTWVAKAIRPVERFGGTVE